MLGLVAARDNQLTFGSVKKQCPIDSVLWGQPIPTKSQFCFALFLTDCSYNLCRALPRPGRDSAQLLHLLQCINAHFCRFCRDFRDPRGGAWENIFPIGLQLQSLPGSAALRQRSGRTFTLAPVYKWPFLPILPRFPRPPGETTFLDIWK